MFRQATLWRELQSFMLGLLLVPYLALQFVPHGTMLDAEARLVLCTGHGPITMSAAGDEDAPRAGETCPWAVAGASALPAPEAAALVALSVETSFIWPTMALFEAVPALVSTPPARGPPSDDAVT